MQRVPPQKDKRHHLNFDSIRTFLWGHLDKRLTVVHMVVALSFRYASRPLRREGAHSRVDPRQSKSQPMAARHQVMVHVVLPQRCELPGQGHFGVADEVRKLVH